jgi:ATP-binding cassette subfamily B protein
LVLLFAQANFDLALPDYLSQIINVGIQQSGVEHAAPEAIRQSQMERVLLFVDVDQQDDVLDAYTLVEEESATFDDLLAEYPAAEEDLYIRNELDEDRLAALEVQMAPALLAVVAIQQMMDNPDAAPAGEVPDLGFDPSQLPPGMTVFDVLAQLPAARRSQITEALSSQFDALGAQALRQGALSAVRAENEALGADIGALQTNYILRVGGIMLLMTLLSAAATIGVGYYSARTAAGLGRDLRKDVFTKVESFSSAEFDQIPTASLITRSTNDITQIQNVTMMIVRLGIYAPILGVGGIIRALAKSASMWWTIALALVVLIGVIALVFGTTMPKFRLIQKLVDRLNLVARENLSGMMVIRAFNRQDFEEERFEQANQDLTENTLFTTRVMAVMFPIMMMILNVLSVVIIWVGSQEVAMGAMQVGDMMAFLQYALQIVFAFLMVSILLIVLPRASVSADRIAEVLEVEPRIQDPVAPRTLNGNFRGQVEFRKVSFRYPGADEDVLQDINFVAKPGQTTAFIGSTGSGKSTVVNLIPRFFDVTGGQILIDDMDIREVTQHDLRQRIGYVPQKGVLFSGTIASNLRLADEDAAEPQMEQAVAIAQASDFLAGKAEGLASEIAQGGANVSGGQKQRLSIARALVKQAPIYIFDDSFSALDFRTELNLRKALKQNTADSTILVVTQRVASVMDAEQIVVLEQGRVAGIGTHDELMKSNQNYQEIALSQLSLEELS